MRLEQSQILYERTIGPGVTTTAFFRRSGPNPMGPGWTNQLDRDEHTRILIRRPWERVMIEKRSPF